MILKKNGLWWQNSELSKQTLIISGYFLVLDEIRYLCLQKDKIMTKAEIVNEISLKTGTGRKEALQIVEGFMDSVKKSLVNGENVYLRGFGSFTLKHRAEKVARNITNNTTMIVPAHDVPHFKPSRDFTLD